MTKEQFADKKFPFPDERKERDACLLGWEACEAQQSVKLPDDFYNCLPKGYVFENEEPTVSNLYDSDDEMYDGQCVITMLMKGEGEVIETPAPQQLFTREQVMELAKTAMFNVKTGEWETFSDLTNYMDTNFPKQ